MCSPRCLAGTCQNSNTVPSAPNGFSYTQRIWHSWIQSSKSNPDALAKDALVLATEEPVDAIVDIATLTGAALRTLGTDIAAVLGNDEALKSQVKASAERVDEPVWELPLANRYRPELDSTLADLRNMGGANAGTITAALFLQEFVAGKPWVHIDIAGTAQSWTASKWRNKGTTGFGTRLLIDLALNFKA